MAVREYTEELYKVNLRVGYVEELVEKDSRYANGIRMDIQEEISMISPRTMEEAYQCALRVEEKIARKQSFNQRKRTSSWKMKIWSTKGRVQ